MSKMELNCVSDVHIASYILQVQPILYKEVFNQLSGLSDLEIPISDESKNKLIVVLEGVSSEYLSGRSQQLAQINGVISVTLVYHHTETQSDLDQEIV